MPQSLSNVLIHIIFSTKNRETVIVDEGKKNIHAYIATVVRDMGANAYRVGGTEDHVHIACSLPRTLSQSDFIKKIKGASSQWGKEHGLNDLYWQNGFGIFSISISHLPKLLQYIENQVEHHKKKTFKEEFREFLNRYNIEYDEKYVWD